MTRAQSDQLKEAMRAESDPRRKLALQVVFWLLRSELAGTVDAVLCGSRAMSRMVADILADIRPSFAEGLENGAEPNPQVRRPDDAKLVKAWQAAQSETLRERKRPGTGGVELSELLAGPTRAKIMLHLKRLYPRDKVRSFHSVGRSLDRLQLPYREDKRGPKS